MRPRCSLGARVGLAMPCGQHLLSKMTKNSCRRIAQSAHFRMVSAQYSSGIKTVIFMMGLPTKLAREQPTVHAVGLGKTLPLPVQLLPGPHKRNTFGIEGQKYSPTGVWLAEKVWGSNCWYPCRISHNVGHGTMV